MIIFRYYGADFYFNQNKTLLDEEKRQDLAISRAKEAAQKAMDRSENLAKKLQNIKAEAQMTVLKAEEKVQSAAREAEELIKQFQKEVKAKIEMNSEIEMQEDVINQDKSKKVT